MKPHSEAVAEYWQKRYPPRVNYTPPPGADENDVRKPVMLIWVDDFGGRFVVADDDKR